MQHADASPRQAAELAGELGTLLGTIINLAAVIADDLPHDSDAARDLQALISAARHGSRLTGQLASLATAPPASR